MQRFNYPKIKNTTCKTHPYNAHIYIHVLFIAVHMQYFMSSSAVPLLFIQNQISKQGFIANTELKTSSLQITGKNNNY